MKRLFIALVAVATISLPTAKAGVLFDPDGGGTDTAFQLDVFDWSVSSAIALGAAQTQPGSDFDLATHAKLATFNNSAAQTAMTGLGTAYEYTFVAGLTERTLLNAPPGPPAIGDNAVFALSPNQNFGVTNFFEIYYDPTQNAVDLAGTGFDDTSYVGALGNNAVLQGIVTASFGSFTLGPPLAPLALDGFGADDYPGIDTISGGGFTNISISVQIIDFDPAFFPGLTLPLALEFTTQNVLNFTKVDPSAAFVLTKGGGPTMIGASTGSTGPINGVDLGQGSDFMLQQDSSTSINAVPEPSTCFAFAAIAVVAAGRRRRSLKK